MMTKNIASKKKIGFTYVPSTNQNKQAEQTAHQLSMDKIIYLKNTGKSKLREIIASWH